METVGVGRIGRSRNITTNTADVLCLCSSVLSECMPKVPSPAPEFNIT
jgi:hypothetical protein